MSAKSRSERAPRTWKIVLAFGLAGAVVVAFTQLAGRERSVPASCPEGLKRVSFRCCGVGQQLENGQCSARATRCAEAMELTGGGQCVAQNARIRQTGGSVNFGAADWEAIPENVRRPFSVAPFAIDRLEVTYARFSQCADAEQCPRLHGELGAPVRNVSPEVAAQFCRFAGGALPSSAQWLFAAAGVEARRFPWGNTGLVCRRASFGLVQGPCANGALGPELAGARPPGKTPQGVLDMAGNVAEWTLDPDGSYRARGGSYLSRIAAELKSWSEEIRRSPAPHVGFRCAYDR